MKSKVLVGIVFLLISCLPDDDFISPDEQLKKDVKAIDNYLADNGINAIKDATGIRIQLIQLGTDGLPPNNGNNIVVNYTGRLFSNGVIFDDGTVAGKLPDYISGWQIGLSMLPEGSVAKLYIPSGYAYGNTGSGSIPANSILVFDVELESVTPTTSQINRLATDTVAIDDYITEQAIANVVKHESGIRYVITQEGAGATPSSIYSQVKVDYVGKLLEDGTTFFTQIVEPTSDFSSRIVNFPQGLLIGLQLLKQGDKATFYVPSGLAFGPEGVRSNTTGEVVIPPNANIIFEIELLDVIE